MTEREDYAEATTGPSRSATSLALNTVWFVAGNVVVKPLWFVFLTLICMRLLGVEGYGSFTSAMAIGALLAALADLGTTEGATREASKAEQDAATVLANVIGLRILLAAVLLAGCSVLVSLTPAPRVILLGLLYALLLRINELLRGFFKAFEVLQYEAYSIVIERGLAIAVGWAVLAATRSAVGVLAGMSIGTLGASFFTLVLLHRRVLPVERRLLKASGWSAFVRRSFPLGVFQLLSLTLTSLGIVLVRLAGDLTATGHYGTASRITEAMMLLPSAGIATLWPRIIRSYYDADTETFRRWSRRLIGGYTLMSVLVAAVLFPLAPFILHLLTGGTEYVQGVVYFQIFMVLFPVMTLKFLTSMTLLATNHQRRTVARIALATAGYLVSAPYLLFVLHLSPQWVLLPMGLAYLFIAVGNLVHLRHVQLPS